MKPDRIVHALLCCALSLLPAAAAVAAADQALIEDFPAGSIRSAEQAELALSRLPAARTEVEQRYARDKADCYDRFLVSSCLSDVQQRQRAARSVLRKVEVEARAFLRKEKAAERDRAVAERQRRAAEQGGRSIPLSGAARDGGESGDAGDSGTGAE